jgi:hypothetical protein
MTKIYLISSLAALAFFSYAQHQGMSFTGARGQQLASSGTGGSGSSGRGGSWSSGSGRSSTMSHK